MKAVAWTNYGAPDVLKLKTFDTPSPKKNEVLIKIHASTVTAGDCRLRALKIPKGFGLLTRLAFGLTKPRAPIIGMDVSGEIEAIGKDVTLFNIGDHVFGTAGMTLGANAEYTCLTESSALVIKPKSFSHEQAASIIFGGLTALHFIKDQAKIKRGQNVLINGASGAVGTASIQLAKYLGAAVTGVCSAANSELVLSLGAKYVVNYTKEDFTQNRKTYDVILDTVGNLTLAQCQKSLTAQGKLILINADLATHLRSIFQKNVICGVAGESKAALNYLKERIEAGDIKAVIDRVYPLEKTADAHRYVDKGHKKGSVVLSLKT